MGEASSADEPPAVSNGVHRAVVVPLHAFSNLNPRGDMSVVVVTGSCGLIGAESVRHFSAAGHTVVGIDNNMREYFFGADGSTNWVRDRLAVEVPGYDHHAVDIRDADAVNRIFAKYGKAITLVVHSAAQPSHDWAAR